MAHVKCPRCLTAKKITGLGGMMKECPICKGIGYIEKPIDEAIKEANKEIVEQGFKSNKSKKSNEAVI